MVSALNKTPTLFVTLGVPGSGKTHFASRFSKQYKLFHLNSDRIRLEITPQPVFTPEEHGSVFRIMDHLAEEVLSLGQSVMYDANPNKRTHRRRLHRLAADQGAPLLILYFDTPPDIAWRRIQQRAKTVPNGLKKYYRPVPRPDFENMVKELQPPEANEPYVRVDGQALFDQQVRKVLNWFRKN